MNGVFWLRINPNACIDVVKTGKDGYGEYVEYKTLYSERLYRMERAHFVLNYTDRI